MKFPKYWARGSQSAQKSDGQTVSFSVWQWSDESVEDARRKANARASTLVLKLANEVPLARYTYSDRPLREETLESIANSDGREIAVITRNAYGAQVLNTAKAMFIDIDFPKQSGGSLVGQLGRLFGKAPPSQEETAVEQVKAWAATRPELGIRVYRTAAGLRCLITSHLFDPLQSDTLNILQTLNSDPLYIRLCKAQECFRARLTPKYWRCGANAPPVARYPWEDSSAEQRYRQWEQHYRQATTNYATCRLITQIGGGNVHPEVRPILNTHDRLACSTQNLTLA